MTRRAGIAFACALYACAQCAHAQTIWDADDGDTFFFRDSFVDGTDPANQDEITPNVRLARGNTQPLYNAAQEGSWSFGSPAGTLWAFSDLNGNPSFTYGDGASNFGALNFADFTSALQTSIGNLIVGRPGVLYMTAENTYVDIVFRDWRAFGGGGFSYDRAIPAPSGAALLALGLVANARRRRS